MMWKRKNKTTETCTNWEEFYNIEKEKLKKDIETKNDNIKNIILNIIDTKKDEVEYSKKNEMVLIIKDDDDGDLKLELSLSDNKKIFEIGYYKRYSTNYCFDIDKKSPFFDIFIKMYYKLDFEHDQESFIEKSKDLTKLYTKLSSIDVISTRKSKLQKIDKLKD